MHGKKTKPGLSESDALARKANERWLPLLTAATTTKKPLDQHNRRQLDLGYTCALQLVEENLGDKQLLAGPGGVEPPGVQ